MKESAAFFSLLDYIIFFCLLIVSFMIGIISAFKGNRSPEEYLLGNRSLKPLPVSMSLLSSFISVINLVGFTTEVYLHGTQLSLISIGCIIGILNSLFIILPVIYPLKLTSIHEYINMRFDSPNLQVLLMVLMIINANFFIGACVYGTAIALAAVAPFSYTTIILLMGIICTIYSTVGGIRAVVWTDVFQLIVMVTGMLIYIIAGVIKAGGLSNLISIAEEGGRIEFFNMNPSLYERHNFYNTIVFGIFYYGTIFGVSQINTQRICAVGTLSEAKRVLLYAMVGFLVLHILVFLGGLVVYASYAGCDPLLEGKIEKYNQVLSFFIMDKLGHIIGLPGIFAATLISSTLSSFSSVVNGQVAIIWRDLLMKFKMFSEASPLKCTLINKILSFICGGLFIVMAFVTAKTKSIIQLTLSISGIVNGLIFGVFMLGICFPISNKKGAWSGITFSCIFLCWIYIGSLKYGIPPEILPVSTEFCPVSVMDNNTVSEFITPLKGTTTGMTLSDDNYNSTTAKPESFPLMYLYTISYTFYIVIGPILVVVIGLIVSYFTGGNKGNEVPRELAFQWSRKLPHRKNKVEYSFILQENRAEKALPLFIKVTSL